MKLFYDHDHLIAKDRTVFVDEEGKMRYWGIYDFSFKHRSRIFDPDDREAGYVQKDVSREEDVVELFDPSGTVLDELCREGDDFHLKRRDLRYTGDIAKGGIEGFLSADQGILEVKREEDVLFGIMVIFGLSEMMRKDQE